MGGAFENDLLTIVMMHQFFINGLVVEDDLGVEFVEDKDAVFHR